MHYGRSLICILILKQANLFYVYMPFPDADLRGTWNSKIYNTLTIELTDGFFPLLPMKLANSTEYLREFTFLLAE